MANLDELLATACQMMSLKPIRALKSGGQKTVHLVEQGSHERVLKLVQIGSSDPAAIERAKREVDLLAKTSHPNVVRVESGLIELGSPVAGAAWLEEYLDGADLSDCLGSQWGWDRVRDLGIELAAGVGALHNQHVVHRDLSANNVRKLADGTFKVMDPGFAKHTLRSGLTVGGQPGTRGFMTPEHLQAYSGPTPASDVFAIGALMYAAATGDVPFPYRGDDADYVDRLANGDYIAISTVRPDCPQRLDCVITRALHGQPARRYRNGGNLQAALEGTR